MKFSFRLYIAGGKPQSARAVANLRKICDEHLSGRYELEVVDIYQSPELAEEDQVLAVPALILCSPDGAQRLVGDLSDEARVLNLLGIEGHG